MSVPSSESDPPHSPASMSPHLEPKGGGVTLSCWRRGGGTQFGRLEGKPGTFYTLCCQLPPIYVLTNLDIHLRLVNTHLHVDIFNFFLLGNVSFFQKVILSSQKIICGNSKKYQPKGTFYLGRGSVYSGPTPAPGGGETKLFPHCIMGSQVRLNL